ncbi:MAG: sulfotransferase [Planctomycetes bacterium]|nr:sulfotransferase [Planctomycetota bacterium]MCB9885136.1 sulfotransferase [Planctomycetota bacterium]
MIDFLHVGMPKAASTWLQEAFFAHHPQLAVLGTVAGAGDVHHRFRQEVRRLVRGGDLSADVPAFQRAIEALARERQGQRRAAGHVAEVLGVSSEILAGDWPTGRNTRFLAEALARCWPDAKVVLVLRDQRRLLESSHQEYVRQGGTQGLGAFVFGPGVSRGTVHDDELRRTHVVEYAKLAPKVSLYQQCFGRERVHVTCIEQLVADPAAFVAGLAAFLGIAPTAPPEQRTNPQLSPAALAVLRRCNHVFSTDHHPRYGWMPVNALLTAFAAQRLGAARASENPYWLPHVVSAHAQRRLAEGWLPVLDRWLLRHVPKRPARLTQLPEALRTFLDQVFRDDTAALQPLVGFDPAAHGYPAPTQ